MKNLKIAVLFFCVFKLAAASNFNEYKRSKLNLNIEIDSLEFHSKIMRIDSLSYDVRLSHANEALKYVNNKNLLSKRNYILNYKIYLFGYLKKNDSAIHTSKFILKSINEENKNAIAHQYFNLGYYFNKNFQRDSAYHYFILSKNIFLKLGDSAKIGESLANISVIKSKFGDFVGSDETAIEALGFINENNKNYRVYIYNQLGRSSRSQKDYHEAIYWYDKVLKYSSNNEEKIMILQNKTNSLRDLIV